MTSTATLTVPERIALARTYHAENRIIQGAWRRGGGGGRELVCALAAFGPDINGSGDCPAELMPQWLAALVPSIDDGIAVDQVQWFSGGLIDLASRWHVLDDAAWERIRTGFMIASVKMALDSAKPVQPDPVPDYWPAVVDACDQVCTALKSGDPAELERARAAAWAAARAAEAAARAAEAAARAAEAAAWAAARAAAWAAARAAARAAAWAAEAAARAAEAAAWAVAWAAAWAAEAAAWAAAEAAAEAAARAAAWKNIAGILFAMIEAEIAAADGEPGRA